MPMARVNGGTMVLVTSLPQSVFRNCQTVFQPIKKTLYVFWSKSGGTNDNGQLRNKNGKMIPITSEMR